MPFRPTFRQLEYIVAVAECGHFGKAAQRCKVSQPTLSVQVSGVEDGLGIQLFERTPSAIRPTPTGERFIHGARRTLAALNDLVDAANQDSRNLGGLVRIGTPPSFGPYFLPTFLPPIHRAYPGLRIHIQEERPAAVETAVLEGMLDCGIGPSCHTPGLSEISLGIERLYLCLPADHRLAGAGSVRVADLRGEHLLALGSGNRLLENVRHLADAANAVIVADYEGTSLDAIRQMIAIGMGCSLFPELYARAELRQADDVRVLIIEDWQETRPISLYFRETSGRRNHFETLAEDAQRAASTLKLRSAGPG